MVVKRSMEFMTLDDVVQGTNLPFVAADTGPLPAMPGVYCHVAPDLAVLYAGSASGKRGLATRLGNELRAIKQAQAHNTPIMRRSRMAAVISGLAESDTTAYFAQCDSAADAKMWEQRIFQLSTLLTGFPPILRGWDVRGATADAFRWAHQVLEQDKRLGSEYPRL